MFRLIAYVYGKPEKAQELKEILMELVRKSMKEPGNIELLMHEKADDPATFVFYETYTDRAAFETHLAAPYSRQFAQDLEEKSLKRRDGEIVELRQVDL